MADWIFQLMDSAGYFGLAALMWLENIFPPIPSELVMPLAGFKVAQGEFSLLGIVLAGTAGSLAGAYMFYGLGRGLGEERLKALCERHGRWIAITPEDVDKATSWFQRHGAATVFFCRLVPGLRSVISIPAGLARQNLLQFTLYSLLGTALWCLLLGLAGYLMGENFKQVGQYLNPISWLVVAAAFAWYVRRILRHRG